MKHKLFYCDSSSCKCGAFKTHNIYCQQENFNIKLIFLSNFFMYCQFTSYILLLLYFVIMHFREVCSNKFHNCAMFDISVRAYWASEASPTLGYSIEISCGIHIYTIVTMEIAM